MPLNTIALGATGHKASVRRGGDFVTQPLFSVSLMWLLAGMVGSREQVQSIGCTAFVCNAFTTKIPQRTLAHVVNQAGQTRRDFRLQLLQCCGVCALSSACLGPKGKVVVLDNVIRNLNSCCIHPHAPATAGCLPMMGAAAAGDEQRQSQRCNCRCEQVTQRHQASGRAEWQSRDECWAPKHPLPTVCNPHADATAALGVGINHPPGVCSAGTTGTTHTSQRHKHQKAMMPWSYSISKHS